MLKRFFLFSFLIMAGVASAQTVIPGGVIDGDTTWTMDGSPYQITGDVLLTSGTTLEIAPGVEVDFGTGASVLHGGASGCHTLRIHHVAFGDQDTERRRRMGWKRRPSSGIGAAVTKKAPPQLAGLVMVVML